MTRSKWKTPSIDTEYFKKKHNEISRSSIITQKLIGMTVSVYNGKIYTELNLTKDMLGHKCGEFAFTRKEFLFKKKKKNLKNKQKWVKKLIQTFFDLVKSKNGIQNIVKKNLQSNFYTLLKTLKSKILLKKNLKTII